MFDEDIKIAAPGNIVSKSKSSDPYVSDEYKRESEKGNTDKAKQVGERLAKEVIANINKFPVADGEEEMASQRGVMMTFAAIIALEENLSSSIVLQTAKNSFNHTLEALGTDIYKAVSDSGAFSFYYLAYRRGTEVVRRMGQTFAMLCSHDGDPIYHELGEAIYCWFKSFAEKIIGEAGIN